MIELQHLSKSYGSHQVIRDISTVLRPGEIVGFLGANGAGKSTTMNMLTGCLPPTSGSILLNGKNITQHPRLVKRQVGYLPEIPPLYEGMTVTEQLRFGGQLKQPGISRGELAQQIDQACQAMDLVPVKNRLISHLSKGYRQRVGLAQAILGSPEVLVLDEPTVGLDPVQIREIHKRILALSEGRIILFSSHILSEIASICTRILVLSGGVLAADGTPEELKSSLEKTNVLTLSAAGDPEKIGAILRSFPQITKITRLAAHNGADSGVCSGAHTGADTDVYSGAEGEFRYELLLDGEDIRAAQAGSMTGGDIRAALAAALVGNGISLLSLGYKPVSLEDIYAHFAQNTIQKNASGSGDPDADA